MVFVQMNVGFRCGGGIGVAIVTRSPAGVDGATAPGEPLRTTSAG